MKTAADRPSQAEIAWHGSHTRSGVSLFRYTWDNPLPQVAIDRIDFLSAMTKAAPFLVAVTCEPVSAAADE